MFLQTFVQNNPVLSVVFILGFLFLLGTFAFVMVRFSGGPRCCGECRKKGMLYCDETQSRRLPETESEK